MGGVRRARVRAHAVVLAATLVVTSIWLAVPAAGAVTITPATLPNATISVAYSQTLTAAGGTAPYAFAVTSGTLPAGLSLSTGGVISGTPTAIGCSRVTVRATDSGGSTGSTAYDVVVAPSGALLYSQCFSTDTNTLPGTYTEFTHTAATGATGSVTAGVGALQNVAGCDRQKFTRAGFSGDLTVVGKLTGPTNGNWSIGVVLGNREFTFAPGWGGAQRGAFRIHRADTTTYSGADVFVNNTDMGFVPSMTHLHTMQLEWRKVPREVRVTVTDGQGVAAPFTHTWNVDDAFDATAGVGFAQACNSGTMSFDDLIVVGVAVSPTTLPNPTFGTAYSQTVTATGGTAPWTFAVSSGSLPAGLSLSNVGVLSGTPTTAGAASTFTISATDAGNRVGYRSYSVTVAKAAQTITFGALAQRTIGDVFTVSATASSGLAVTFSSGTGAVCTVAGSTVTAVTAGTCTITAAQAGNASYDAAPNVQQSFTTVSPPAPPTEVALPQASGGSALVTTLPVVLPPSGMVTVDVTLLGSGGCTLFISRGTVVTTASGAPFSGRIFPPSTGSGQPIDNACTFTSSAGTALTFSSASVSSRDAYALAVTELLTVTMALPADATDPSGVRVTRVDGATGAITTTKGTTRGSTISFTTSRLGTFGVATVIDLARAASAPSVTADIPVRFAGRAVGPAVTLNGTGGSLAIAAGTTATVKDLGAPFFGTLAPPAATSVSGVASAASLSANVPQGLRFDKPATLTLPLPTGQENGAFVPVGVAGSGALSCMSGTLAGSGVATEITGTSVYALLPAATPTVIAADSARARATDGAMSGYGSAWAGQSASATLCPTQHVEVTVKLRNTGDLAWIKGTASQVVLGSNGPLGNTRDFDRGILIAPLYNRDRFATHAEATVRPGETGTFTFTLRAPSTAGTYAVHLRPVIEGQQWLSDEGIYWGMTVR